MILFLIPLLSVAQNIGIPKNADKIIVHNSLTAEQNFIKAKQTLADSDIAIAMQDRDIFQIQTGSIRQRDNATFQYLINCKDGRISITGTWTTTLSMGVASGGFGLSQGSGNHSIKYKGNEKYVFNRMNDFAKQLGGDIVYNITTEFVVKRIKSDDDVYN